MHSSFVSDSFALLQNRLLNEHTKKGGEVESGKHYLSGEKGWIFNNNLIIVSFSSGVPTI